MSEIKPVLDYVLASSSELTTWALGVGAGSVATVLGTSYRRPSLISHRLPYLLFVPGWLCLAVSLNKGNDLVGRYLASKMVSAEAVKTISSGMNDLFDTQRATLLYALVFFTMWLATYLYFWIFDDSFPGKEQK